MYLAHYNTFFNTVKMEALAALKLIHLEFQLHVNEVQDMIVQLQLDRERIQM